MNVDLFKFLSDSNLKVRSVNIFGSAIIGLHILSEEPIRNRISFLNQLRVQFFLYDHLHDIVTARRVYQIPECATARAPISGTRTLLYTQRVITAQLFNQI